MEYSIGVYALLYVLFALCLIFPPTEFQAAGFTLEYLFYALGLLDEEFLQFIKYHLRRTVLTAFAHSFIPLGFFAWLAFIEPESRTLMVGQNWWWAFQVAIFLPLITAPIVFWMHWQQYESHPLVKTLRLYDANWHSVASVINAEYRRVDKFTVTLGGIRRVIVTDSWIIVTGMYRIRVSQQADVRVAVVKTDTHAVSHLTDPGAGGVQFLTILVENIARNIPAFTIRLNSMDYRDLRAKLQAPIEKARDIMIHQSLSERFVQAFVNHARENPRYPVSAEARTSLDPCIGCMQITANCKLSKLCEDLPAEERPRNEEGHLRGICTPCYCRPLWCVFCMGRWFASRQDQRRPGEWLSGQAPCPTCRAPFCLLDVCLVEGLDSESFISVAE